MHPANEKRRYIITPSLIGWALTQIRSLETVGENDELCHKFCIDLLMQIVEALGIAMMLSHGFNGISNHWQLDCLLNKLLRLTTTTTKSKLCITGPSRGNPPLITADSPQKWPITLLHISMSSSWDSVIYGNPWLICNHVIGWFSMEWH